MDITDADRYGDTVRAALDGVRSLAGADTSVGRTVITPSGVTVIPVSKVSFGTASGGFDLGERKNTPRDLGGGGTGVTVTPVAFLTIDMNGSINLININEPRAGAVESVTQLIEKSPEIIGKIKSLF